MLIKDKVINSGWACLDVPITEPLSEVAKLLGDIFPVKNHSITSIIKQQNKNLDSNSLSSRFGFGEFPLHTDGATFSIPPRFILLRAAVNDTSKQSTIIAHFEWPEPSSEFYKLWADAMMIVETGTSNFFAPLISRKTHNRDDFIRYNPCCMFPACNSSHHSFKLFQSFILEAQLHEVEWVKGQVVVLDNWRVLHGRSIAKSPQNIGMRELERCWVK